MNKRAAIALTAVAVVAAAAYYMFRTPKGSSTVTDLNDPFAPIIEDPVINVSAPQLLEIDDGPGWFNSLAQEARHVASTVSAFFYPSGEKYRGLTDAAEARYGLPHGLIYRQCYQESHFRDDIITGKVRSAAGAVGILQIIPRYHPDIGEAGALDPAKAIPYAAKFMSQLKKQFGTWEIALAAYNWGPGNVARTASINWPQETKKYVKEITADVNVRNV